MTKSQIPKGATSSRQRAGSLRYFWQGVMRVVWWCSSALVCFVILGFGIYLGFGISGLSGHSPNLVEGFLFRGRGITRRGFVTRSGAPEFAGGVAHLEFQLAAGGDVGVGE